MTHLKSWSPQERLKVYERDCNSQYLQIFATENSSNPKIIVKILAQTSDTQINLHTENHYHYSYFRRKNLLSNNSTDCASYEL